MRPSRLSSAYGRETSVKFWLMARAGFCMMEVSAPVGPSGLPLFFGIIGDAHDMLSYCQRPRCPGPAGALQPYAAGTVRITEECGVWNVRAASAPYCSACFSDERPPPSTGGCAVWGSGGLKRQEKWCLDSWQGELLRHFCPASEITTNFQLCCSLFSSNRLAWDHRRKPDHSFEEILS